MSHVVSAPAACCLRPAAGGDVSPGWQPRQCGGPAVGGDPRLGTHGLACMVGQRLAIHACVPVAHSMVAYLPARHRGARSAPGRLRHALRVFSPRCLRRIVPRAAACASMRAACTWCSSTAPGRSSSREGNVGHSSKHGSALSYAHGRAVARKPGRPKLKPALAHAARVVCAGRAFTRACSAAPRCACCPTPCRGTLDALLHHSAKHPWDPQKLLALVRRQAGCCLQQSTQHARSKYRHHTH